MKIKTKKQEIDLVKKKIIKVSSIIIIIIVIAISLFVMQFMVRKGLMDPQINFVVGDCLYRTSENNEWQKAEVGIKISKGFIFKTGSNSVMDLILQDNCAVRMTSHSSLVLDSLDPNSISINMESGELFGKIKKLARFQDLEIKTPVTVASVRGTEFCTRSYDGKAEQLCVEGAVALSPLSISDKKVIVTKNTKSYATAKGEINNPVPMSHDEIVRIKTIIDSIQLNRIRVATNKLLFQSGKWEITDEMKQELDKIFDVVKKEKGIIRIIGHTDNVGNSEANKDLSLKRAEAIRKYFISKGMDSEKIQCVGMGDSQPISKNDTEEGRKTNRRVEFMIVK